MKSLLSSEGHQDILSRLDQIRPDQSRVWGKMNVSQMLAHCTEALHMASGKINPKRVFIGRIIGPLMRKVYSNDVPFRKNGPTSTELIISGSPDFSSQKAILKETINEFVRGGVVGITKHPHPFFGPLTKEEWAIGMYKHLDHHFRQFGA